MDKSKIIKLAVAGILGILAIVYYFSSRQEEATYENFLKNETIIENKAEEEAVREEKTGIKVYVAGEVNQPGVIELEEGSRVEDAIEGAGGVKPDANLKNVNLAYEVSDGEKIYIPNLSEEESQTETSAPTSSKTIPNSNGKVNINKATASELTSVPGIGASTAQKIITYREENGRFQTIEDIKKVSGIGDSKYESMKDHICVK